MKTDSIEICDKKKYPWCTPFEYYLPILVDVSGALFHHFVWFMIGGSRFFCPKATTFFPFLLMRGG